MSTPKTKIHKTFKKELRGFMLSPINSLRKKLIFVNLMIGKIIFYEIVFFCIRQSHKNLT